MTRTAGFVVGFLIIFSMVVVAQTKFSGTQKCPKPDPQYTLVVGDRPNHVLSLSKGKCSWTQGELVGLQIKEDEDTIISDTSGSRARDRGYGVSTLANGDKAFVRFDGTTTSKGETPVSGQGTWSFTGGTGKLKGIKGKGTFKGTYSPDGTSTFDIEGDYQVPVTTSRK